MAHVASSSDGPARWLGPTIAGSGFLVPIPLGLLLAGPAGTTIAVVAAFATAAALFGTGFLIVGRQERAEVAAERRTRSADSPEDGSGTELGRRLGEIRDRNRSG